MADPQFLTYRGERMTLSTTRKAVDCWACGSPIEKGSAVYRPLGNGMRRMKRVHAACGVRFGEPPKFLAKPVAGPSVGTQR